jgi:hypothetical protein
MKTSLFAFSLILSMAAIAPLSTAHPAKAMAKAMAKATASALTQKAMKTVTGEVSSVDSAKNEVVIKDDAGAEVRLMFDKTTKVTKEGKPITIAEVKPAEKVICDAEETANGWLAKSIKVSSVKTGL